MAASHAMTAPRLPVIKVVGVSAAGKSTLVAALRRAGYDARPVSQEHANVPDLWNRFDLPTLLIYLDVSLEQQLIRRTDVSWTEDARVQELARLAHAREHANLHINTSSLEADRVLAIVLAWLEGKRVRRNDGPLPPVGPTGAPVK